MPVPAIAPAAARLPATETTKSTSVRAATRMVVIPALVGTPSAVTRVLPQKVKEKGQGQKKARQ